MLSLILGRQILTLGVGGRLTRQPTNPQTQSVFDDLGMRLNNQLSYILHL